MSGTKGMRGRDDESGEKLRAELREQPCCGQIVTACRIWMKTPHFCRSPLLGALAPAWDLAVVG